MVFQITTAPALSWEVVIYANGLFVALSNNTGTVNVIMTSSDGIVWTNRITPAIPTVEFQTMVYDGSEFIAFGGNSTTQSIYSADGITWAQRTLGGQYSIQGAAYGAGVYVMVRGSTYYSYDAVNWVYIPVTQFWGKGQVDYVNGNFVTVGATADVGVSTDGLSWVKRVIPLTSRGRIAYGNGVYVLTRGWFGSDQVMVSSDLITWNTHSVGLGSQWNDITFDNGLFVMTAIDTSGTKVASSPDGINWTGIAINGDAPGKVWTGIAGNGNGLYAMVNQNGDAAYTLLTADFSALPLLGSAPLEVQFTDESTGSIIDRLWTFDDGDTSTDVNPLHDYISPSVYSPSLFITYNQFQVVIPPTRAWGHVIYGNSLFVAIAFTGVTDNVMTSPDGINWIQRTTPTILSIYGSPQAIRTICWTGSKFHAFIQDQSTNCISSTDGITWTLTSLSGNVYSLGVDYSQSSGIFVMSNGGSLKYSYDVLSWTICPGASAALGYQAQHNIMVVNNIFVSTGNGSGSGTTTIGKSSNGVNWSAGTLPIIIRDGWIAYGNGVYVLTRGVISSPIVLVSSDLVTWNQIDVGVTKYWNTITFDNGFFVMTAETSSGTKAMSSPDGINWTVIPFVGDTTNVWGGVAGNGSGLFATVSQQGKAAYNNLETNTELKVDYITVESGSNVPLMRRRRALVKSGL